MRGQAAIVEHVVRELGLGDGTWWATDAAGSPLAGAARGKGRRRTLVLSSDAVATLLARPRGGSAWTRR